MQRLQISKLQAAILRHAARECRERGGCVPSSGNFKRALFGRASGFSTSERVTLCRSLRRLVANGMLTKADFGWYRITPKGRACLASRADDC